MHGQQNKKNNII